NQLEVCWHHYALDNLDVLAPNDWIAPSIFAHIPGGTRGPSWCPDAANTDTTTSNLESGCLFPYNRSVAIYHCPTDTSQVQGTNGQPLPQLRNRSYNMSQSVNGAPEFLVALNIHGVSDIPSWKKLTQIIAPLPAQAFVFIDEHPDTL